MNRIKKIQSKAVKLIKRHPLASFFSALGILFLTIAIVSFIGKPQAEGEEAVSPPQPVSIYSIGTTSRLTVQGKVEKNGVITVMAQTPGVVNTLPVKLGQTITPGQTLVTLATTYTGASLPAQQLSLARAQLDFQTQTSTIQAELINRQKDMANANADNAEALRKISANSLPLSREQLNLTKDILTTLDQNIKTLESTNVDGANDALILSTKQLKSQFLAAQNQLTQVINTIDYQTNPDQPAAQLPLMTRDLTLKQLELQEKTLALNQELSQINYKIAAIGAALMRPSAPFGGTVSRLHVVPGDLVNPGQPLVTLSGVTNAATVGIALPPGTAQKIGQLEPAEVTLGGQVYSLPILHNTRQALDDQFAYVYVTLPPETYAQLNDQQFLTLTLPLGYPDSVGALPNLPLDLVHQTQSGAYVFVIDAGLAATRPVKLGQVMGDRVEILDGLSTGDQVIVDRSVTAGEAVVAKE